MYAFSIRCAASGSPRCPAHEDVPTGIFSSNPFDFKQFRTLLRNRVSPTPFPSITSALFPRGGERIPHAHPLGASHRKSCVCHTSEKSPANSFIRHTSKNSLPQVPCLPHLRYPPGLCASFLPIRDEFNSPIARQALLLIRPRGHQSRITSHPSVPLHAQSRGATIAPYACYVRVKYWETSSPLSVSKQGERTGVRHVLDAGPDRRSILNGDVGRPESNL